nr:1-acyl-sn-glycerol-3-phosphate acyltransferase [Bacilli bacterium]
SLDPFFVSVSFPGKPIYFMASDDLLRIKYASFWIRHCAAPIPKKKDVADLQAALTCIKIAKEGGNVCIFPEGNRTYSGKLAHLEPGVAKLAKSMGLPILLYRLQNGYGVDPRWGKKIRRGKTRGEVVEVVPAEKVAEMDENALTSLIESKISAPLDHSKKYRSKTRAEFLERVLYVCPKCHKLQTLSTDKDRISCTCGLSATYNEDMTFSSEDPAFGFVEVSDWYQWQKEFIRDYPIEKKNVLLSDDMVEVLYSKQDGVKERIALGTLKMDRFGFTVSTLSDDIRYSFSDLRGVGITGKNKVVCYTKKGDSITFRGRERFNAYKYMQMYARISGKLDESL